MAACVAHLDADLREWNREGNVAVEQASAAFGTSAAFLQKTLSGKGLNVYYIEVIAKTPGRRAQVSLTVKCLNAKRRALYQVLSTSDPEREESKLGLYFKSHADTRMLDLRIEKSGDGPAQVEGLLIRDDDAGRVPRAPQIDLDQYTAPPWRGPTAYDESVVFIGEEDQELSAPLLFDPEQVLTVTDASKAAVFKNGTDYRVSRTGIVRLPGSRMPVVSPSSLPSGELGWYDLRGKHVLVTYRHRQRCTGPKPGDAKQILTETYKKLLLKLPLKVVVLGDSISLGTGTSGCSSQPPFMPPWPDLLAYRWKHDFNNPSLKILNLSLGGQTTYWAKEIAPSCAASLRPDLTLIAFGMNDFWSVAPEAFKSNIQAVIHAIEKANPKAEFVLISSVPFDPDYCSDKVCLANFNGYLDALKSLVGPRVAYVDMNAMGRYLVGKKGHKSLAVDPMHPNDYCARWYAAAVASLLEPPQGKQRPDTGNKNRDRAP